MKRILALATFCTFSALSAVAASPEDSFPSKPVRIVVPYPAGGLLDVSIRAMAAKLSEEWKQPVILDNRPGANEAIGADIVAKAPADGYTLFGCSESALLLNPLLYKKLSYDPEKDFVPVSQMFQVPMAVSVLSSSKAKTIEEFVELAKSRAQQPMNFGSSGVPSYLPLAMLAKDQNLNMTHIPYNGAPPMIQDFLGGRLDTVLLTTSLAEPYIKAGTVRVLAVSSKSRLAAWPNVPTFAETKIRDINAEIMIGLVAPKGTPEKIVAKISSTVERILNSPEFRSKNTEPYGFVTTASTPENFRKYLAASRPVQSERVRISGATVN